MPTVAWLVTAALVATRVLAAFSFIPVLSMRSFPGPVRLMLCLTLAVLLTPHVAPAPASATLPLLFKAVAMEFVLGVLLGGTVRIAFDALALAGQFIDTQIGQSAAMAFDPTLEVPRGPLSRLVGLLASAVFLGADLHLHVLVAISDSFLRVPAGAVLDPLNATYSWLDLGGVMIHAGFRLAAPIIAFVFLMNVFIAVLTRLAPSMNLYFSLGFIVSIFGGEFVLLVSLPTMLQAHLDLVHETLNRIPEILEQVGGGALGR